MENSMTQKWISDSGILFPFNGEIVIHATPGPGVWQVVQSPNPSDARLGLIKIADKFEFPYKIYKTGGEDVIDRVVDLWNSDLYVKTEKNLGVIFNGTKGTGKTVSSKILCNKLDIPVLIVNGSFDGRILGFIQSIQFECVILIDEAEKTFSGDADQILLKLIDGVYNASRKLYILTTNRLNINENLLGRPGRIRYIKEFGNLPFASVKEFIEDNLIDKSKAEDVLREVDLLEISTIDVLKSIVEEYNIMGSIPDNNLMNIPRAKNIYDIAFFQGVDSSNAEKVKAKILEYIKAEKPEDVSLLDFFIEGVVKDSEGEEISSTVEISSRIPEISYCYTNRITADYSTLWKDTNTSGGVAVTDVDPNGFLLMKSAWGDGETYLCMVLRKRDSNSIYGKKYTV